MTWSQSEAKVVGRFIFNVRPLPTVIQIIHETISISYRTITQIDWNWSNLVAMSRAPPPPKRNFKNRTLISTNQPMPIVGTGFNVARSLQQSESNSSLAPKAQRQKHVVEEEEEEMEPELASFVSDLHEILEMQPDVVIGEDVEIKGDFQYDGLLHLRGRFEGRLLTEGDVYVGPNGVLKANLQNINRLYIDGGHVVGNFSVQQVGISGDAIIRGNINCRYLEIANDSKCIIEGHVYTHPLAPAIVPFPRERQQSTKSESLPSLPSSLPVPQPIIINPAPLSSSSAKVPQQERTVANTAHVHSAPVSPLRETTEASIQAEEADVDEILTPAELALRAKQQAKERRKEAKRQQQDEALRQAHGLSQLSPSAPPADESRNDITQQPENAQDTESNDIKLVSGHIGSLDEDTVAAAAESSEPHPLNQSLDASGAWSDVGDIRSLAPSPVKLHPEHTDRSSASAETTIPEGDAETDTSAEQNHSSTAATTSLIMSPTENQRKEQEEADKMNNADHNSQSPSIVSSPVKINPSTSTDVINHAQNGHTDGAEAAVEESAVVSAKEQDEVEAGKIEAGGIPQETSDTKDAAAAEDSNSHNHDNAEASSEAKVVAAEADHGVPPTENEDDGSPEAQSSDIPAADHVTTTAPVGEGEGAGEEGAVWRDRL